MKSFKIILLLAGMALTAGCADYLDIVPEGVPTMDNAFSNKINTEKYLFTCYSRLPNPTDALNYPAIFCGDEMWWNIDEVNDYSGRIAQGYQDVNDPWLNYWDGGGSRSGHNLFIGIRDCNIFLENIHLPHDLDSYEKVQWSAEVKFIKAYLHFFLLQLYGPIPIIRENLPVDASPEEVRMYREPVDDVVEYIVQLLDEAKAGLPLQVYAQQVNAGRITQPIALALKAKVLIWAASPLFNGNPDYSDFKDNKGRQLIHAGTPDQAKWQRAAEAVKNAIDTCHLAGHALLHDFVPVSVPGAMSDITRLKCTLRSTVTEKFNPEIVWPYTNDVNDELQHKCMPLIASGNYNGNTNEWGATLKIAEQFYTDKGVPIDEDPDWDYEGRYGVRQADIDHQYYIRTGETTAKLNFNREPRFHAYLGFDRGIFEGAGMPESNFYYLQTRQGEISGMRSQSDHLSTGYQIKKLINLGTVYSSSTSNTLNKVRYTYPLIRLADLYLHYAEALNEVGGPGPEVYRWVDSIRLRAGLQGVEASWAKAKPAARNKPYSKETMREIIKSERLIELSFEGQRFWDLRRWKDALKHLNEPVRGWNYTEGSVEEYYRVANIWNQRVFTFKDYLWPLKLNTVIINSNLEQNPGW
ncbi:MAG: RagB/SusD family nutrient uptake outer membrane protein [Prevotellaceae bacterium]|jgi:hypothetical protein|nr:RagB/SusD family nutrient uptake outer membrane protein [Prevotellaceae bacterium]